MRGLYKLRPSAAPVKGNKVHLLGSGPILVACPAAQELLAEKFGVAADVWSATSYKELRRECLEVERWNLLHPAAAGAAKLPGDNPGQGGGRLPGGQDYMRAVPEMIARWVPGGLYTLGTDGFGRSDTRPALRRHFEVDAECIAVAALAQLARRGQVKPALVQQAIQQFGINPEKISPLRA